MVISCLTRSSLRYLLQHPLQTFLSVLGITLGVAVVVAVNLANQSVNTAFLLSMEQLTGKATHQILSTSGRIPDTFYTNLRIREGIRNSTPMVEGLVRMRDETFSLLGIDFFAEFPFHRHTTAIDPQALRRILVEPNAVLMAKTTAQRLGIRVGEMVSVSVEGRTRDVEISGFADDADSPALAGLLITDIATAQELLNNRRGLDRIDLILKPEEALRLGAGLPLPLTLTQPRARSAATVQLSRSFQVNLSAMSLLAMLVGGLLIYNTMTFSVLSRCNLLATQRILGVTRSQIFRQVIAEALATGIVGSVCGLALGSLLAHFLLRLVTRTINDLYYVLRVTELELDPLQFTSGFILGICVTMIASLVPAMEAARSQPQAAGRYSVIESRSHRAAPWLALIGALLSTAGWYIAQLPNQSLIVGFIALFLVIIGCSLIIPVLVLIVAQLLLQLFRRFFRGIGALAVRGIAAGLSRTGLAIAALTVAVSTTIGMGIMVASFRSTVEDWLHWTLQADIYVSAPHSISSRSDGTLDTEVLALVEPLPGIREISSGRRNKVETEQGPIDLLALSMASRSYRGFHFKEQSLPDIWRKFRDGDAILVSEPYAYHQRLSVGSRIGLFTAEGLQYFLVGGVFYDYGSDRGMLVMNRQVYQRLWRDSEISALGVYLEPGVNTTHTLQAINQALAGVDQQLLIRSNGEIRSSSLKIFDRTFTVTQVLRLLAVGVAFIGIFNALLALLLERAKEHAVLRAIGVTPRQLLGLVSLQAGLMGFLAGLLALPLGWVMSGILIQVINLRSFGWTIQPLIPSGVLLEAMLLSLLAALLAAIYPAWKITRVQPAAALREE